MLSIEEMVRKESKDEMCIYKQAHANQYDACYICDGFNYNCDSYELKLDMKKERLFKKRKNAL